MTEAAVSFAGNLTDDPELRHPDGGLARATFRVAGSRAAKAGGVVLHRGPERTATDNTTAPSTWAVPNLRT